MTVRRKTARQVLAEITATLGPDLEDARARLPLKVCGADREWPEGPVKVSGIAGFPDGSYVNIEVLRVRDGIQEADIVLTAEFDNLAAGQRLARRLRGILIGPPAPAAERGNPGTAPAPSHPGAQHYPRAGRLPAGPAHEPGPEI